MSSLKVIVKESRKCDSIHVEC